MRLAIVCSWLNQYGGAERVLEAVHDLYPDAPVWTSIHVPAALPEHFRSWDIRSSFMNHLPFRRRGYQFYLPLYPLAFESLDLRGYDVVLSVTSGFAHGIITSADTRHICYCLTPARFLWSYHSYMEREGTRRLARWLLPLFLTGLRQWDRLAAERVDQFVAISRTVRRRILKHYRRDAPIIYPPVRTRGLEPPSAAGDYYLIVSRLVPYKRIDLAVRAFARLGLPLRIIGEGRDRAALQALAKPNIEFLGYLSDAEVQKQMARCLALVFPGEEDFGLTPLEAMALGRPTIAYAAGGALDTIEDGRTGIYFHEPTVEAICGAVEQLQRTRFDPAYLRQQALRYDVAVFQEQLSRLIASAAREAAPGAGP